MCVCVCVSGDCNSSLCLLVLSIGILNYHTGRCLKCSQAYCLSSLLSNNAAIEVNGNITDKFQKNLRSTINECKQIISTDCKRRYINLNQGSPVLRGLIKVHREDTSICPIVNFRNTPSSNLAKMFTNTLKTYIPLPYAYMSSIQYK